jgi:GAF domain-containing protein
MHPFLGVPIMQGKRLLGLIYLTNKIDQQEFTRTDERVIEMLASYAAIAIHNAQLYRGMEERDRILSQRNEDLALIDDLAAAMASSLEVDQILHRTLTRIMEYLDVETGEIYLRRRTGTPSPVSTPGQCCRQLYQGCLFDRGRSGRNG